MVAEEAAGGFSVSQATIAISATVVFSVLMALLFRVSVTAKAGYMQSMDPAYPFLQAVAMHHVNGRPFMEYMSLALAEGQEVVDGVNVTEELVRFEEEFHLQDADGQDVAATKGPVTNKASPNMKKAYLAVPPGGHLVMIYEWS